MIPATILFGGSFNPPTLAHRAAVDAVAAAFPGVPLVILPAPCVAHKDPATLAPFAHRVAMTQLMLDGVEAACVSDFALPVNSVQTIDLLRAWRAAHAGRHIVWLMGADSFASLPQWQAWEEIVETTALYVLARRDQIDPLHATEAAVRYAALERAAPHGLLQGAGWYMGADFHASFSATAVRAALAAGEASPYLVPGVAAYIAAHGLYGGGGR